MQKIAAIVRRHPHVTVLSDEVYKFTVYGGAEPGDSSAVGHYHFARLPDMWDRTITISSCGKTFSVTGWQVGWMVGPAKFIAPIQAVLPCVQFCAASPIQDALSKVIKQAEKPFEGSSRYAITANILDSELTVYFKFNMIATMRGCRLNSRRNVRCLAKVFVMQDCNRCHHKVDSF